MVKRDVGDVTVVVNNAGIVSGKKLDEVSDASVLLTMEVNTMAHFWVSSHNSAIAWIDVVHVQIGVVH